MKENCKTCAHCRESYGGGWCVRKKKKVKYSGACDKWKGEGMMDSIKLIIGEDGAARMYDDEFDVVIHCESEADQEQLIRKLNRMNWIPTKERLPEKDGKYLCCWQGMSIETGLFLNGHFRLYGEIKDDLVTAWMELPELYKAGEQE